MTHLLNDLLILALIGLTGFLAQWLAWRIRLPAILFLLVAGILAGPVFDLLDPDALFGELLFPFISICVAIILFEGSLTLKRKELAEIGPSVRNMVSYGAILNGIVTCIATHYLTGLDWSLSALFGAIMVVTGPTVIIPMLRSIRPNARIARTLRWEGIIIDPLGALFAVLVFEWIMAQQTGSSLGHILLIFSSTVILGTILGIAAGYLFGLVLRHHLIPEFLQNFAAIAMVVITFSLANTLMHESGLLSVTIMGIWLANMKGVHIRDILNFKESLTIMFVSALFIILAARIDMNALASMGLAALGVMLVMQFVSRPLKVMFSTLGSKLSIRERLLIAWIGPRGIVAAAVSAVFALRLENAGIGAADLLVPLAFSVIIGTVLIQSLTGRALARWLDVCEPDSSGFLIMGANPVAIMIARALDRIGVSTLLCDSQWENISAARMEGLRTYYGNPMSEHADVHLDLTGLGGLLALSHYDAVNTTVALRFRDEFGFRNVYTLASFEDAAANHKHRASEFYKGRVLFGSNIDYAQIIRMINRGAEIKQTNLSDNYTYEDWLQNHQVDQAIPMFMRDTAERLHWICEEQDIKPEAGWSVFALSLTEQKTTKKSPASN